MIKEKLDFYRSILLERRNYILDIIERLQEMSQIKEAELELNKKYTDHLADQGSESGGREELFMFISRELQYLYRINDAINSIDKGDYGICKICGEEIPKERLEAVPTTDTCINCKNSQIKKMYLN